MPKFSTKMSGPWSVLAGIVVLLTAGSARAVDNPASCTNDIDCVATPECGGDICPWVGPNPRTCQPAGTGTKGHEGWCTADTDCKCHSLGATCVSFNCTFTKPSDAPGAGTGGATGSGGSTGA